MPGNLAVALETACVLSNWRADRQMMSRTASPYGNSWKDGGRGERLSKPGTNGLAKLVKGIAVPIIN